MWPGIKILDVYIIRKFLGTYFFAIGLIIVIVVIFDAAEKTEDFYTYGAPLRKIIFDYYLNFIPFFINQFSGLFTFIAVIFFTSKMAYNTEIIAILSGGVSFNRFLWPYFLSAAAITLLSLALNLYIIPSANEKRIAFERQYTRVGQRTRSEPNLYRQIEPGTFLYLRGFNSASNRAAFLVLETYENGVKVSSLEAASPTFIPEEQRWVADRSILRTFDGENETFDNTQKLDTVINLSPNELGRPQDIVPSLNIVQLNEYIRQQRMKGSDMVVSLKVEKQKRFALPVSTFILTLIGVSLSSRKLRGGTGLHIGIGITLCFSFILFSRFFEEFAKNGVMNPNLAVWIPNILFTIIAVYLYIKAPK